MKCCYPGCLRNHNSPVECPRCRVSIYCSQQCLDKDYSCHRSICGQTSNYQLEDFEEAKGVVKKVLGKGSYGEVRLVQHKLTKQKYAMKAILKDSVTDEASLHVLLREIAVHKSLKHRNIIQLYDHFEDSECVYLLLEYAPKGALFFKIRKARKLGEEEARKYFRQTALGIGFLHKHEIIHRDLKPENLLLDANDNIKICDFGWCVQGTEVRTTFCGTLDYMAPEMFSKWGHSYEIDLWALGVLLYELLHGNAPFTAKSDTEKARQIMRGEFSIGSHVSREATDLIRKLLQVVPSKRLTCEGILDHPWVAKWIEKPVGAIFECELSGIGQAEGIVTAVNGNQCDVFFEKANASLKVPLEEVQSMLCEVQSPIEIEGQGAGLGLVEDISRRTIELEQETPGRLADESTQVADPTTKEARLFDSDLELRDLKAQVNSYFEVIDRRWPGVDYSSIKPHRIEQPLAQESTSGNPIEDQPTQRLSSRKSLNLDESSEALTLRKKELAELAAKLQSTSVLIDDQPRQKREISNLKAPVKEGGILEWFGGLFGCANSR